MGENITKISDLQLRDLLDSRTDNVWSTPAEIMRELDRRANNRMAKTALIISTISVVLSFLGILADVLMKLPGGYR